MLAASASRLPLLPVAVKLSTPGTDGDRFKKRVENSEQPQRGEEPCNLRERTELRRTNRHENVLTGAGRPLSAEFFAASSIHCHRFERVSAVPPRHYPDFDRFCQLASGVHLVPVYRRLSGDTLTPAHGLSPTRPRFVRLFVRKRHRRREGGPLQAFYLRAVHASRGLRPSGADHPLRLGMHDARSGRPAGRTAAQG